MKNKNMVKEHSILNRKFKKVTRTKGFNCVKLFLLIFKLQRDIFFSKELIQILRCNCNMLEMGPVRNFNVKKRKDFVGT